jgi:hypothetical protein
LVLVTCTAQSFVLSHKRTETILTSFCLSLKKAATRCGFTVLEFWWENSQGYWKEKGVSQLRAFIEDHTANNGHVFLLNRPFDGSLDRAATEAIHRYAVGNSTTVVVAANPEDVRAAKLADGSAFILLEQYRRDSNWYSAAVLTERQEQRYGPLYLVDSLLQSEPPPESDGGSHANADTQKRAGPFRRVLATLGF